MTRDAGDIPILDRFVDANDLILQAIDSRLGIVVAIHEFAKPTSNATDRQRQAVSNPQHDATINAATIIQIFGYVEGFIEESGPLLAPLIKQMHKGIRKDLMQAQKERRKDHLENGLPGNAIPVTERFGRDLFDASLPDAPLMQLNRDLPRPERWEDALGRIGLGAPTNRPLPDDLAKNLNEVAQIRNVLLHRMGRMDEIALKANAEGPWTQLGETVRIDHTIYRRYIAALYTYTDELQDRFRILMGLPPRNASLNDWRTRVPAGG